MSSGDALSPVDGRYRAEVAPLRNLFSERSLFLERARVELLYLRDLVKSGALEIEPQELDPEALIKVFPEDWYVQVKALEEKLGHDVKALEVWLRGFLEGRGYPRLAPLVHLGLTSDDTNNLAYGLLLKKALDEMIGQYERLLAKLRDLAKNHAKDVMLARTHGVPAVPTTFGKEMGVFAWRLSERIEALKAIKPYGKLGGAVGNHNALCFLNEEFDWLSFSAKFVSSLGLRYAPLTKQVVPHEATSDVLHQIMLINHIMAELSRDLWTYNMLGLISFQRKGVSSSTMPHKVNPVDLEDAEGQVDISNSLLSLLAYRLVSTRLQRDLSDSPIRRMMGQALAHSYLACGRVVRALEYMKVNSEFMVNEVRAHPEVLSEAVQVSLRATGDPLGYEEVHGNITNMEELKKRVGGELGKRLLRLTPEEYVGMAERLAKMAAEKSAQL
ncbi:lyase family protein [Tardisphaera miroshnichenkoae]